MQLHSDLLKLNWLFIVDYVVVCQINYASRPFNCSMLEQASMYYAYGVRQISVVEQSKLIHVRLAISVH